MKSSIKIKSGNPEIEVNQAVTEWVQDRLTEAPPIMQAKPDQVYLAIPTILQRMIMRHFRSMQSSTQIGTFADSDPKNVFSTLFGFKVVPGYEMALVLYFPHAVEDPERAIYRVPFSLFS